MNPQKITAFVAGAAVAAAMWALVWPAGDSVAPEIPAVDQRVERMETPSPADGAAWLRDLENGATAADRAAAAGRLARLPITSFPNALEGVELVRDHSLTLPARALLARWAAIDGEAAVAWAWPRLRSTGQWDRAFAEMVAAWAWSRPEHLAAWARHQPNAQERSPTLLEVESAETPLVGWDELNKIWQALAKSNLRLAFEILQLRGGSSSEDSRIRNSLNSVDQIQEALSTFDCLGEMETYKFSGYDQILAGSLLQRWKEIDPEDFAKSPHAHLLPGQPISPGLPELKPVVRQHQEWHGEFQKWRSSTPHTRPDMTGWNPAKREAWQDFEALMPAAPEGR